MLATQCKHVVQATVVEPWASASEENSFGALRATSLTTLTIRILPHDVSPADIRILLTQLPNLEGLTALVESDRRNNHEKPQDQSMSTSAASSEVTLSKEPTRVLKLKELHLCVADNSLFRGFAAPNLERLTLSGPGCNVTNMSEVLQSVSTKLLWFNLESPNSTLLLKHAAGNTQGTQDSEQKTVFPLLQLFITDASLSASQLRSSFALFLLSYSYSSERASHSRARICCLLC